MVRNEDFDNLTAASADLTDTTVGTGGLTVNGGVTIDGAGDAGSEGLVLETEMDVYSQVDSSQSTGDAPNFNVTVTDSQANRPEIHWRRHVRQNGPGDEAFGVYDATNSNLLFEVEESGNVVLDGGSTFEFPLGSDMRAGVDSAAGNDNQEWNIQHHDNSGGDEIHWLRNAASTEAFAVRNNTVGYNNRLLSVDDSGDTSISGGLSVSDNTEMLESTAGSTVIRNNAGNPINIQLSPSGRAFLSGNTTETVIDTQDQWYEISGTWNDAHMNFLSHDGNGGMTYDGDVTTQIAYDIGGSYSSPDQNATYEIAVFKDGSIKPNTPVEFSPPRAGEVLSLPPIHGFTDSTTSGMRHSIRVRCTTGATNLTVPALSFRIKG